MLNSTDSDIQFTVENEQGGKLLFLDTVVHRTRKCAKLSVYRKPTANKDDFIHYFSRHSARTKSGVVTGFYSRAMRISSPEFFQEEIAYITGAHRMIKYSLRLLYRLHRKAREVSRNEERKVDFLVVPYSKKREVVVTKLLSKAGVAVANTAGRRIMDMVRPNGSKGKGQKTSVVYGNHCKGCESIYYSETARDIEKRLYKHKRDLHHHHRTSNLLVVHPGEHGHLPSWNAARVIHALRMLKAAHISSAEKSMNHRERYVNLAGTTGRLIHAAINKTQRRSQSPRTVHRRPAR